MCPLPGDNNLCHELQFPATVTHIDHTFLHFPSQLSLEGKTTTTSLSLSISLKHHANNPSPTHKSPSKANVKCLPSPVKAHNRGSVINLPVAESTDLVASPIPSPDDERRKRISLAAPLWPCSHQPIHHDWLGMEVATPKRGRSATTTGQNVNNQRNSPLHLMLNFSLRHFFVLWRFTPGSTRMVEVCCSIVRQ